MYPCTEEHTSCGRRWRRFRIRFLQMGFISNGMTWRNVWTATTRYKKGDVVRYGGQVYICNTGLIWRQQMHLA